MHPKAVIVGLAGIAAVVGLLAIGAEHIGREPDVGGGNPAAPGTDMPAGQPASAAPAAGAQPDGAQPAGAPAAGAQAESPAPGQQPAADQDNGVPVPPPAADAAPDQQASTPPPAELKPVDLARPLAENAGVLAIGDRRLQLAGVLPTDPGLICHGDNGKDWPCGMMARTALRTLLRGRTVTCDVPDTEWHGAVTAACRYAKTDLGEWLVRNGWAEAQPGSPLVAAADEARAAKRGIHGDDPRKDRPSTLAPPPARENPLNPI